jgi:hypothetical protein
MSLFLLRARSGDGPARQGDGLLSGLSEADIHCPKRTRGFKSPSPRSMTLLTVLDFIFMYVYGLE